MADFCDLFVKTGLLSIEIVKQTFIIFTLFEDLIQFLVIMRNFLKIHFFNKSQFDLNLQPTTDVLKKFRFSFPILVNLFNIGLILQSIQEYAICQFYHILNCCFFPCLFFLIKFVRNNIFKLSDELVEMLTILSSSK